MIWMKRAPKKAGWYWWRESLDGGGEGGATKILWVSAEGDVSDLRSFEVTPDQACSVGGEWYGPLRAPGGYAIENINKIGVIYP